MQLPNAESERLILVASLSRSPVDCVLDCRSEPAKSTRLSLPICTCGGLRAERHRVAGWVHQVELACDTLGWQPGARTGCSRWHLRLQPWCVLAAGPGAGVPIRMDELPSGRVSQLSTVIV